jgi:RND family efflux transporter MFP subunit
VARNLARAGLAEAQAVLDTALAGRKYTTLTSPIDGVVVLRSKQVGDLATPGVAILSIESRVRLVFQTSVSESRVASVDVKAPASVEIDALDGIVTQGEILRIVPSGDPITRRYDVEISLPPDLRAFPGMFGRAHFIVGSDSVVLVANEALVQRGGLTGVFVVADDSTARFRWVHTGRVFDRTTEIRAGLTGGETIVALDDARVRDGDRVTIAGQGVDQ